VRLFIDECLSPQLALRLNQTGRHDAVHPLHIGRRREPDHRVLAWCIAKA
jgi:predicted nuclease of predicted toxin-antitoxin system